MKNCMSTRGRKPWSNICAAEQPGTCRPFCQSEIKPSPVWTTTPAVREMGLRLAGCGYDPRLFRRMQIGGQDRLVEYDDFALRFFPKETVRNPGAARMAARKPPGAFRFFIFAEFAVRGDPEPAYGADRYWEARLREKFPNAKFEIANVAFTAIDSHVILPMARECARQEGVLLVRLGRYRKRGRPSGRPSRLARLSKGA